MMTPKIFEDNDLLNDVVRYINAFHYTSKLPHTVNVESMIKFVMASHYGKKADNGNSYGSGIHKGMKVRYAGNTSSPATDGHTIWFNKNFFSSEFYHFALGIPEEFIPHVAVLFYHGIEIHESTHGWIIAKNGHYNAKGQNDETFKNIAIYAKKNVADILAIKGKKKQVLIMCMNVIEDIYIDKYVVPTQFPYAKKLYNWFLRLLFSMEALQNQCGEELTINFVHYLRNPDPVVNSWLLRTYPELAKWAKILAGIHVGVGFQKRCGVVWELYNAMIEFLQLEDEEETEDEEEAEEYQDGFFGAAPESGGEEDEDEDSKKAEELDVTAAAKEREIEQAEENYAKNHRWMDVSNYVDVFDADFDSRRDAFDDVEGAICKRNPELVAFARAFQYGRHKKAPRKFGLHSGVLDDGDLYRIKEGNIFATERECKKGRSDTQAVIIGDLSGSTFGRDSSSKEYVCVELMSLCFSLHTVLKRAGVAVASIAHTTNHGSEIYGIAAHRMKLSPDGKTVSTNRDHEAFDKSVRYAKYSGNCDGAALRFGTQLFSEDRKAKKVVILVNDGMPAESHIRGMNGSTALLQEIDDQRKKGIVVVAIAAIPSVYEGLRKLYGDKYTFRGYGKYVVEDSKRLLKEMMSH